jgi:hypothetical protein
MQISSKTAGKKESIPTKPVDITDPVEVINRIAEAPAGHTQSVTIKKDATPATGKISESAIVADTFNQQSDTLNEQLGSLKEDNDFLEVFKHKPVLKLSDAIGVNDKFLFIREIFNGNPEAYNQAIKKLDETGSLADAEAIIISYTGETIESGAANQLFDLVKRKFPGNE